MRRLAKNNRAFSLIEVVIAAVLLSMVVIVVCTLSTRSLTAVKSNREHELAWDMLDRHITMIEAGGIDDFIKAGQFSGSFGEEENGDSGHLWQVQIEEQEADNLYRIDVTVFWANGSVSAATMLNGKGLLADENTDGEGG